jgi:hypothetical protein
VSAFLDHVRQKHRRQRAKRDARATRRPLHRRQSVPNHPRRTFVRALMPQQIDPVPAMTTSPGAPSVAPYNAMSASVTTSISPTPSGMSVSRMRSRSSLRRAPRETNLRGDQISAPQLRRRAGAVDRLAHCRRGSRNSNSQGVRRSSAALANHSQIGVHDDGFRLGSAAVDTNHRVLRVQASSRREICCSSFSTHSWGSGRLENNPINIIDYSRVR